MTPTWRTGSLFLGTLWHQRTGYDQERHCQGDFPDWSNLVAPDVDSGSISNLFKSKQLQNWSRNWGKRQHGCYNLQGCYSQAWGCPCPCSLGWFSHSTISRMPSSLQSLFYIHVLSCRRIHWEMPLAISAPRFYWFSRLVCSEWDELRMTRTADCEARSKKVYPKRSTASDSQFEVLALFALCLVPPVINPDE